MNIKYVNKYYNIAVMNLNVVAKYKLQGMQLCHNQIIKDFCKTVVEFHTVEISCPMYEWRVFLRELKVDEKLPLNEKNDHTGSYFISALVLFILKKSILKLYSVELTKMGRN